MICSIYVRTLRLKTKLTIQLHSLVLPTLIVISELQITSNKLFTWFNNNHMKVIPHFWKKSTSFEFKNSEKSLFWWNLVDSNSIEKLLGIHIDSGLTFDEHIFSICNKIGNKINVLSILVNYMSFDKTLEFSHWHLHVFT